MQLVKGKPNEGGAVGGCGRGCRGKNNQIDSGEGLAVIATLVNDESQLIDCN